MLWKKVRESLSRLSINEFKLATNNMLGYDMPRVKLNQFIDVMKWKSMHDKCEQSNAKDTKADEVCRLH